MIQILDAIHVSPDHVPLLHQAFEEDVQRDLKTHPDEITRLQHLLDTLQQREKTGFREYLAGQVSQEVWQVVAGEIRHQREAIQQQLNSLARTQEGVLKDLATALDILHRLRELYARLNGTEQRELLRLIVRKIVVNADGTILEVELMPPFAYIYGKAEGVKKQSAAREIETATPNWGGGTRSKFVILCSTDVSSVRAGGTQTPLTYPIQWISTK